MKTKLVLLSLFVCATIYVSAQQKEKAQSLALEFSKQKHKQKEKNGITKVSDKVVEAVPDIQSNISAYEGKYEITGLGQFISLAKSSNNTWDAVFTDSRENKTASLKDIHIESGLFSASIQYNNGKTEPFEAVLLLRTENGEKSKGIGIKQLLTLSNGFTLDKAFFKKIE